MAMKNIKHIVYSSDLENILFIQNAKNNGVDCISVVDARSAVYVATGICAQNIEPVIVCIASSNSSRSAYAGMTEAFYRQLPVILVTFGKSLDYSKELNDVIYSHYEVSNEEDVYNLDNINYPCHIEVLDEPHNINKVECSNIQKLLCSNLDENKYLYISQEIYFEDNKYKCKVVKGGMTNCHDGALANILGASLARIRRRYIGLVGENEFIHDMNTLGNINVNDLLLYIVVAEKNNQIITDYAKSLSFKTFSIKESDVNTQILRNYINNNQKSLVLVYKED